MGGDSQTDNHRHDTDRKQAQSDGITRVFEPLPGTLVRRSRVIGWVLAYGHAAAGLPYWPKIVKADDKS
jgi:hypothetical protein